MVMTLWVNLMAIGLKVGLNMKANHSGVDYKEGLKKTKQNAIKDQTGTHEKHGEWLLSAV